MVTYWGVFCRSLVRHLSFLLACWLVLLSFSASCDALPPELQHSFEEQLRRIIERNPRYVWGGSESIEKGLDCSGYIFLAAKRAGIPGVTRTTALFMANGRGGWHGVDVEFMRGCEIRPLDLVWWTWKTKPNPRPCGHIGVLLLGPKSGLVEVTHASERRGVILEPVAGRLLEDMVKARRLTIGDGK